MSCKLECVICENFIEKESDALYNYVGDIYCKECMESEESR